MKPIPKFPAVERDLSLVLDEKILWTDLSRAIKTKATGQLEDVRFVEIYRGKGIPSGKKSLTLSLRFRDIDGTLTHEAVDKMQNDIVANLEQCVGATLRTL
jgi:phenylalanyl-tRNA synthetase beta chain